MVNTKSTPSYFLGPTSIGIIMSLLDLWWQYRSEIIKPSICNIGGVKYVRQPSSTHIKQRIVRNIIFIGQIALPTLIYYKTVTTSKFIMLVVHNWVAKLPPQEMCRAITKRQREEECSLVYDYRPWTRKGQHDKKKLSFELILEARDM